MKSAALKLLIQAGNPIISMETPDEPRAVAMVREVAQRHGPAVDRMVGDRGPGHDAAGGDSRRWSSRAKSGRGPATT